MDNDGMPPLIDADEESQNVNRRHRSWGNTLRECKVVILLSYLGPLFAACSCITFPLNFESMGGLHGYVFYITEAVLAVDLLCHIFHVYPDSNHIVSNHRWCTIIIPRCSKIRVCIEIVAILQLQRIFQSCMVGKYLICIKVVRVFKVRDLFKKLERDLAVKYIYINSLKIVILQCYLAHIASCAFYHVAVTFPPPTKDTWLKHLQLGDIGTTQKYIASFYFAIVTMYTVGYGDIHPVNAMEMMFTIGVIMVGLIASIYLIGQISDLFESGVITSELMVKNLKGYMENSGLVHNRLTSQIMLTIRDNEDFKKHVAEDYPIHIRAMLYRPFIEMVGLFQKCSPQFIDHIASEVYEEFLLPGEVIIEGGTIVDQLYIFCDGLLGRMGSRFGNISEEQICDSCCIGMKSFFCNVAHNSTIQVVKPSRILRLHKQALMKILGTNFSDVAVIQGNLQKGANLGFLKLDLGLSMAERKAEQAIRLNLATYARKIDWLKRLLGTGIDVSIADDYRRSPLHVAAENGDEEITKLLITRNLEVNTKDFHGNTPLLEAVSNGHHRVARLLFLEGAFVEDDDAIEIFCVAFLKDSWDTMERFVGTVLNPNAQNYNGRTPLHIAAARGNLKALGILKSAGTCIMSRDSWGQRPIDAAKRLGQQVIIENLRDAAKLELSTPLKE